LICDSDLIPGAERSLVCVAVIFVHWITRAEVRDPKPGNVFVTGREAKGAAESAASGLLQALLESQP
jgi:hypothetical protein